MSLPLGGAGRTAGERAGRASRPPFDRRLLRQTRAARPALVGAVAVGTAMTGAILVQLVALATVIGRAFASPATVSARTLTAPLLLLAGAIVARALLALAGEVVAERGATAVRSELRSRLLRRIVETVPGSGDPTGSAAGSGGAAPAQGELVVLATRGIDALDQYFSGYLPQLVVGTLAPVLLLCFLLFADRWSALILAAALAVVPVFMVLLGQEAAERMRRQWAALQRLGGHFADVVGGITTLKLFDRVDHQLQAIAATTDRLRRAALDTLRYAFLSSFVFELLASVATALVAIVLGLRLLSGAVHLGTALGVLLVASEVFLPLRKASARFHAAADGIGASDAVLAVLGDRPAGGECEEAACCTPEWFDSPGAATRLAPGTLVELRATVLRRPESGFVLGPLDLRISAGERLAVVGPTGCGKSTLLLALLGYLVPASGELVLGESAGSASVDGAALRAWRRRVSWLPQAPAIVSGSVLDNVTLTTGPRGGDALEALHRAGAGDLVTSLGGPRALLREGGSGLSSGERQRLALARVLCRRADLYLLDEPTAHLDRRLEESVVSGIFETAGSAAVVLVTHSSSVAALCDRVLDLAAPRVGAPEGRVPAWAPEPAGVTGRG